MVQTRWEGSMSHQIRTERRKKGNCGKVKTGGGGGGGGRGCALLVGSSKINVIWCISLNQAWRTFRSFCTILFGEILEITLSPHQPSVLRCGYFGIWGNPATKTHTTICSHSGLNNEKLMFVHHGKCCLFVLFSFFLGKIWIGLKSQQI